MSNSDSLSHASEAEIHPTAIIDPSSKVAAGVSVGPYTVIGPGVEIGANTTIGPHVVIQGPTKIGEENTIFQFSSIGEIPQDKKFAGEDSQLIIGNNNTIREFCTINRGTHADQGSTIIGNDNWIMAYVHIAHDCVIGDRTIFSNGASIAGHVIVDDYAVLGGFTLVHQFCHIGAHSFCGMGSALNKDLPPYMMASGNLAKAFGLNKEGLRRREFSEDVIHALHQAYKALIVSKNSRVEQFEKVKDIAEEYSEVREFVKFIENSQRGTVR
ncbi:MAG: acyl-ACP--UDP-N-acetylglucosamine O-acyltransferase [Gammaproteobacteria bacterium]|nr:acyl-ACP--UDP-N-acetylglucosamine O-acyltransferase [Gammaproteobacteria bacterium]